MCVYFTHERAVAQEHLAVTLDLIPLYNSRLFWDSSTFYAQLGSTPFAAWYLSRFTRFFSKLKPLLTEYCLDSPWIKWVSGVISSVLLFFRLPRKKGQKNTINNTRMNAKIAANVRQKRNIGACWLISWQVPFSPCSQQASLHLMTPLSNTCHPSSWWWCAQACSRMLLYYRKYRRWQILFCFLQADYLAEAHIQAECQKLGLCATWMYWSFIDTQDTASNQTLPRSLANAKVNVLV